jgi:hypothetical protein
MVASAANMLLCIPFFFLDVEALFFPPFFFVEGLVKQELDPKHVPGVAAAYICLAPIHRSSGAWLHRHVWIGFLHKERCPETQRAAVGFQ